MRLIQKAFQLAKEEIGVHETGSNNPKILEYLHAVDLDESDQETEETPWCSAFANWCIQKAGGKGTRNGYARSWLHWGKKLTIPEQGCIVVLWRGSPDSDSGHVAFFEGYSQDRTHVKLLGGNQSDSVCIKEYPIRQVLGFRTSKD